MQMLIHSKIRSDELQLVPLMNVKRIFVIFFAVLANSCASIENIPDTEFVEPPKSELATVFIYRANSMPTKANINIKVDNIKRALLPDDKVTWIQVTPGKHILSAGYPSFPDMSAYLEVNFESGKTYLFQYDGAGSGGSGFPIFGTDGKMIGYVSSNNKPWTKLDEKPSSQISDVLIYYKYVNARP